MDTMNEPHSNNGSRKKWLAVGYALLIVALSAGFFWTDVHGAAPAQATIDTALIGELSR